MLYLSGKSTTLFSLNILLKYQSSHQDLGQSCPWLIVYYGNLLLLNHER